MRPLWKSHRLSQLGRRTKFLCCCLYQKSGNIQISDMIVIQICAMFPQMKEISTANITQCSRWFSTQPISPHPHRNRTEYPISYTFSPSRAATSIPSNGIAGATISSAKKATPRRSEELYTEFLESRDRLIGDWYT